MIVGVLRGPLVMVEPWRFLCALTPATAPIILDSARSLSRSVGKFLGRRLAHKRRYEQSKNVRCYALRGGSGILVMRVVVGLGPSGYLKKRELKEGVQKPDKQHCRCTYKAQQLHARLMATTTVQNPKTPFGHRVVSFARRCPRNSIETSRTPRP